MNRTTKLIRTANRIRTRLADIGWPETQEECYEYVSLVSDLADIYDDVCNDNTGDHRLAELRSILQQLCPQMVSEVRALGC